MKKLLSVFLILFFCMNAVGCEGLNRTLKDKFTRKKKTKEDTSRVVRVADEETYPGAVSYKMHYVYFDAWMTELVNYLGQSRKKDIGNCRRALESLQKMKEFLKEEKAVVLEPYIAKVEELKKDFLSGRITSDTDKNAIKRDLNKLWMAVRREFAPYKLDKEWIKPDTQ